MADEAVRLGPAPASESYLKAELIIDACKATGARGGASGIWLPKSERTSFAEALEKAGIAFIGPPPKAIAAMGDKIESKKLARDAGVNIVPGCLDDIATTDEAVKIAHDIGYPVMMKASAGGGGKGMRLAYSEKDVREGFDSVKREGLASFGDDRVFIEKFIENPRHIEIQVLGDQHGNILYLGERECSIQRRHQKVVEEAPVAVRHAANAQGDGRAGGRAGAGGGLFFGGHGRADRLGQGPDRQELLLPGNEHAAAGRASGDRGGDRPRPGRADDPRRRRREAGVQAGRRELNGWSVETRVYAEDPYRGFLPSTGRLVRYRPPTVIASEAKQSSKSRNSGLPRRGSAAPRNDEVRIRVDDGVFEGGEVSMFYDPMIAKLITQAPTREAAIDRQIAALDAFEIDGIGHNIDFLSALMQHPRFRAGNLETDFIADEYPEGFHGAPSDEQLTGDLAAIAALIAASHDARAAEVDGQLGPPIALPLERVMKFDGIDHHVAFTDDGVVVDGGKPVAVDGTTRRGSGWSMPRSTGAS